MSAESWGSNSFSRRPTVLVSSAPVLLHHEIGVGAEYCHLASDQQRRVALWKLDHRIELKPDCDLLDADCRTTG